MQDENKTSSKSSTEVSVKNQEIIGYFSDDVEFVFVYKKTEKLATAMYMVTNLFSDNEPMKWSLRKKVGDLLSDSLSYKDMFASKQIDFVNTLKTKALELVSLLEIAMRSGLVSQMNYSILRGEFSNLIVTLDTTKTDEKRGENELLSKGFFAAPAPLEQTHFPRVHSASPSHAQGHIQREPKPVLQERETTRKAERKASAEEHTAKRSNRQNTILSVIKKRGEISIKDISEIIKDCSEKTIQRELNSFISAGIVKRAGERRWSKYSLV